MATAKTTKTRKPKRYYFARKAHMAAVLWDGEKNGPLAEFDKAGLFTTTDKDKAEKLLNAGYIQVTLTRIKERNLPIPTGDSPSVNYQPGAPGRGYQPAQPNTPMQMELEDGELDGFADDGPDLERPEQVGAKRTLS